MPTPRSPRAARRAVAGVGALVLLAVVAGACGSSGGGHVAAASEARSSKPRTTVAATDAALAARATDHLGALLYRRLAAAGHDNLVVSPYSIEIALAMARTGARGETRTQMDRVLGATAGGGALDRSLNALDAALATRNGTFPLPGGDGKEKGEVRLRGANSLWAQRDERWEQPFLDGLATDYGAGVHLVDYKSDAEAARKAINGWVSDRTASRIPHLIPSGVLDDTTRLVLANALYFKAPWAVAFDAAGQRPFHLVGGATKDVPTMVLAHAPDDARYDSGPGWQAASLPYLGGRLSLVVIVPDDLAAYERGLSGSTLSTIATSSGGPLGKVQAPRFEVRSSVSLADQLSALGMPLAFTDRADFSGMTRQEPLSISAVLHQAWVSVDEKGTEAAAATAVVMGVTSAPVHPQPPHDLVVDKPFLFAVRDVQTGAVLFLGRVTDPTAG